MGRARGGLKATATARRGTSAPSPRRSHRAKIVRGRDLERMTETQLEATSRQLAPLIGQQLPAIKFHRLVLEAMNPSQVGGILGATVDAALPQLVSLVPDTAAVGLRHSPSSDGERDCYPDYRLHVQELDQDLRVELKTLYIDPEDVQMRAAAAAREPAARFRVHGSQVRPHEDALMVLAYRLDPLAEDPDTFCPRVIDIGVFSAYDCVEARDKSLYENGGRWFGETPVVVSRRGAARLLRGEALDTTRYGRKEAEGADFNEHTNFGKLRRIPHKPLQQFLAQHGAAHLQSGNYPRPWHL